MKLTKFSIPLYPVKSDWSEESPPRLYFDSDEEKTEYVAEEFSYCRNDHYAIGGSRTKADRQDARSALNSKRIAFAIKRGYAQHPRNTLVWMATEKFETPNETQAPEPPEPVRA